MDNLEALKILEECKNNVRLACERIINEFGISQTEYNSIRFKFQKLKDNRRQFVKKGTLQAWETLEFMTQSSKRCKSLDGKAIRTPILNLQLKQLHIRLDSLLVDIKSTADLGQVTPKTIASLCLQLIANEEKNYKSARFAKKLSKTGPMETLCQRSSLHSS